MIEIPEEGYVLPPKVMENLYNKFIAPKYDWIDRFEFDEYRVDRTQYYKPIKDRPKRKPGEPVIVLNPGEVVNIKGRLYTNIEVEPENFQTFEDFVNLVGESEVENFRSTMNSGILNYIKYTPIGGINYKAFESGKLNLGLRAKPKKSSELSEKKIKTVPKKTPPTSLGMF